MQLALQPFFQVIRKASLLKVQNECCYFYRYQIVLRCLKACERTLKRRQPLRYWPSWDGVSACLKVWAVVETEGGAALRALWTPRDSELHHPAQARLGATYLSPFSVVGSQRSWRWLLAPHSHPAISPGWASVMLVPAREGLWQACDQVGEFLGQVVLAMAHGTTHMGHGCTLGHFSTPWMLWLPPPHFALDQCWEYLKTS